MKSSIYMVSRSRVAINLFTRRIAAAFTTAVPERTSVSQQHMQKRNNTIPVLQRSLTVVQWVHLTLDVAAGGLMSFGLVNYSSLFY